MTVEAEQVADRMLEQAQVDGQSARRVPDDSLAAEVRAAIRRLARARGIRIRTARLDDSVVAVRLDAALWHESTATMRAKLQPPD